MSDDDDWMTDADRAAYARRPATNGEYRAAPFRSAFMQAAAFISPVQDYRAEEDWVPEGTGSNMFGVYTFVLDKTTKVGGYHHDVTNNIFKLDSTHESLADAFARADELNKQWWKEFLRPELFDEAYPEG